MKAFLIVDEGVLQEYDYKRLIKIWAHPRVVAKLIKAFIHHDDFSAIDFLCRDRVYLEVWLHQLADENDVKALTKLVEASWDELLEEEPSIEGWFDESMDADTKHSSLTGLGYLKPEDPKPRPATSLLFNPEEHCKEESKEEDMPCNESSEVPTPSAEEESGEDIPCSEPPEFSTSSAEES